MNESSFFWVVWFGVGVFWAVVCYFLAQRKNRDTTLAAIMGLLFGIFAAIIYAVMGPGPDPHSASTMPSRPPAHFPKLYGDVIKPRRKPEQPKRPDEP